MPHDITTPVLRNRDLGNGTYLVEFEAPGEATTLQPAQARSPTPRGRSTAVIASPSGTLWTAMATVMKVARRMPPAKEAPTAPNEVDEPIINSPFAEPALHCQIEKGKQPVKPPGRRPKPKREKEKGMSKTLKVFALTVLFAGFGIGFHASFL